MGAGYLIDTNVVTKFLRGLLPEWAMVLMKEVVEIEANLSVITQIELGVYRPTSEIEQQSITQFITGSRIVNLSDEVVDQTIRIRRQHKTKLPDAIIAATAMVNNLTLLSTNDIDFDKIQGLKYKSLTA